MVDVAQLYAARDRVFGALDVLDAASRNAGTPIRSGSPRERFTHLFGVIREVETTVRKTWREELIASRGADLSLSKALAVGAKNDALYVTKLTRKDGETSRTPNANDREGRTADPDRTAPANSSDHDDRSAVVGEDDPFENSTPYALAFKPRTGTPKLIPVKSFGYSLGTADLVRRLLKDGGWGTGRITHGELLKLVSLFAGTTPADANEAIRALSDTELKLIADDMDSSGLGNYAGLSSSQKESFIAKLATQLDSTQFIRIAKAFDDDVQIAEVLARTAGTQHLAAPFIAYCEAKFSAKGSEETKRSAALATAITIAHVNPNNLAQFLTDYPQPSTFVTGVFKAAARHITTTKRSNSHEITGLNEYKPLHHFDTKLLTKINQVASRMASTQEAACFEVFQRTIDTLKWANDHPPAQDSRDSINRALLSTTGLMQADVAKHLAIHSAQHPTYVEWVKQLLKSGESNKVADLVGTVTGISQDKWWWAGYMVAIVNRASTIIESEDNAVIGLVDLAADIASAILNGAKLAAQIAGETIKSIASFIRSNASEGMNLAALIEIGIAHELEGENGRTSREQYIFGKGDGSLGMVKQ